MQLIKIKKIKKNFKMGRVAAKGKTPKSGKK